MHAPFSERFEADQRSGKEHLPLRLALCGPMPPNERCQLLIIVRLLSDKELPSRGNKNPFAEGIGCRYF